MPDRGDLSSTARVFFALWPDPEIREVLARATHRLHERVGGRPTHPDSAHLTLVFIGSVARESLPGIAAAARALSIPEFEIVFDRVGCWRHNGIAWLGPARAPETLMALVAGIEHALDASTVTYDRRAYVPHVTLVRKAECRGLSGEAIVGPLAWRAREFVLVESSLSSRGARYSVLDRFGLGA